jgi:uncharacterized protein
MNLTDGEKLILLMLCDIQKSLNVKGSLDIDALRSSLLAEVKDLAPGPKETQRESSDRASITREVSEILDMWSAVERGYKRLTFDEKREVEAGAGPLGRGVRFSGFDGDTEGDYRALAHFLIEEAGQFERFQGRNLDAHMPALAGYRRMLRLYGPMRPVGSDPRLGVHQIIALANAEKYAD